MPSIMKIALPALAAAGSAYAACSISGTTTIQNQGDATAFASCTGTFSGSIAVATGTTEDINIPGIRVLAGNLVASNNANLKQIGASDMEQLNGDLQLDTLQRLNAVTFPKLKKVNAVKWNALPNLGQIGFSASVEQANTLDIQNTGLKSLDGINIQMAKTIKVYNNDYITEIKMQLGNVSDLLDLSNNNKAVVVELPNLIWANNLNFRACGSVSLPSLEKLNGSFGLRNSGMESFAAPNLTEVGNALAIIGNDQLSNISLPLVTKVSDDLRFANNSALLEVDGLPSLKSVGGAFDISGNMTKVETPKLDEVKGAFNIQSSDNITDSCNPYRALQKKKLIQGKFKCAGDLDNPSTEGTNGNAGNSPKKEGAASTLSAMNGALGLAAMAAVFLI